MEAFCEGMRRRRISRRISRRSFLKHCPLTAPSLGLAPSFVPQIVHATETRPRTPVLWLHRLECPCGSESFMRPAHPLAKDVVRSMPSLGDDDTLMASAGHQAEAILDATIARDKGRDIRAVEGNPPLNQDGMSCIIGGRPFLDQLKHVAQDCKAIISWGSCASWGCVQAAKPDPTQAGHGCIGGSQDGFRDKGSSGDRLTDGAHVAIEVGALPALACAAPEDLADSAERLADVLQWIGASPAMVEGSCLGDAARPPAAARPECKICWRVYDPALGDPVWPVAPGTPFAALPAPWRCPQCDGDAEQFMVLTENT